MLTCKVGDSIINCFDGKFDKHKLKKWSEDNRLVCPDCEKFYEYCHGEIVHPYFRHKEKSKECEEVYSEPETIEHINGKLILYNWLLNLQEKGLVKNVRLESYIKITKQRPDIYFEMNDEKYVIEFQCTPIATVFLERRELYRLANITDIWILGTEKYNIQINKEDISHITRHKVIEKHTGQYLEVKTERICIKNEFIKELLPYKLINLKDYYSYNLEDFDIYQGINKLMLKESLLDLFIKDDIDNYNMRTEEEITRKNLLDEYNKKVEPAKLILKEVTEDLNIKFKAVDDTCVFNLSSGSSEYYFKSIIFENHSIRYTFFIKMDCIDCCTDYITSYPYRYGRKGVKWGEKRRYRNVDSIKYNAIEKNTIMSFIENIIQKTIQDQMSANAIKKQIKKEREDKIEEKRMYYVNILKDFLDEKIILINAGKEKISEDIRFKFLKEFEVTDTFIENVFLKELKFLKRKKVKKYIFMIPKYDSYRRTLGFSSYIRVDDFNDKVLDFFESYGFTNIEYLSDTSEEELNIG